MTKKHVSLLVVFVLLFTTLFTGFVFAADATEWEVADDITINVKAHVQTFGDQTYTDKGEIAFGTEGKAKRLEKFDVTLEGAPADMELVGMAHVQSFGDMPKTGLQTGAIGTSGLAKRIEGLAFKLVKKGTDTLYPGYRVAYAVHMQSFGWGISDKANEIVAKNFDGAEDFAFDGAFAGTRGLSKRIESVSLIIYREAKLAVKGVTSENRREVDVKFNNAIDSESLDKANFTIGDTEATSVELLDDGVTVRAIFNLDNQTKYTLEIASIKDKAGKELEDVELEFTVNDFAAPTVEAVRVEGNKKVVVVFSEPMNPAYANVLGNYQIDDKLFGAAISTSGRETTLLLTSPLTDGVHTLKVSTNLKDFNDFKLISNSTSFTVAKDDVKPAVAKIDSVSQTKVVLTFTKPVADTFTVTPGIGTFSSKSTKDNVTYTLNFSSPLPLSGTEITLTDVVDFYGNKDTIKINVVPVADLTRPEVVSVTAKSQTELLVEFSEDVNLNGTYTLKTVETNPVTKAVTPAYYVNDKSETIKNKVVLTAGTLAVGNYTLEVLGVTDLSPLANAVVPVVKTVAVTDLTKPTVTNVRLIAPTATAAGVIYVEFSEKIDAASALNKANYYYIMDNTKAINLGTAHTLTVLSDGKTVKISVPKLATGETSITSVTVTNIADVAGNVMAGHVQTAFTATLPAVPAISNPKVTGKNTIVVDVTNQINPYSVTASDFLVTAATTPATDIYVINAVYDATKNAITMTVNADLSSEGKFENASLTLKVVAQNLSDIYAQKIALDPTGISVADGIAPVATKLASATYSSSSSEIDVVVELSENLASPVLASTSNYIVAVDGKLATIKSIGYDVATSDAAAKLTIKVNAASSPVGKTLKINYYEEASFKDAANNNLANFEFTTTIK